MATFATGYVPAGSLFDIARTATEERINRNVELVLPKVSRWFADMQMDSTGVVSQGNISRDFLWNKIFYYAAGGVVKGGRSNSDAALYGGSQGSSAWANNAKLFRSAPGTVFPDPFNGVEGKPYRLNVPIRTAEASLGYRWEELQANAFDPIVYDLMRGKEKAFVQKVVNFCANANYLNQTNHYALALVGGTSASNNLTDYAVDATLRTFTFYPTNWGSMRFTLGMELDLWHRSTNTVNRINQKNDGTAIRVFVTDVDVGLNKVTVQIEPDTSILTAGEFTTYFGATGGTSTNSTIYGDGTNSGTYNYTFVTDQGLVQYSAGTFNVASTSPFYHFAGLNSWMKFGDSSGSTNTAFNTLLGDEAVGGSTDLGGAVNVNVHSNHRSHAHNVNAVLTEHKLRLYLDLFARDKGRFDYYLDTAFFSPGVLRAYESTKIGQEYRDRTGRLSSVSNEGSNDSGLVFHHGGKNYDFKEDDCVEYGSVYFHRKGGGNWKMIVPPNPARATKPDGMPGNIPIILAGPPLVGDARLIYRDPSGRPMPAVEIPAFIRMNQVPTEQVCGMKLFNCTEDRVLLNSSPTFAQLPG